MSSKFSVTKQFLLSGIDKGFPNLNNRDTTPGHF